MEKWVSVKTAAELRKCSPRNILDLIKRGKLEGKKKPDGRRWEVLVELPAGTSVGTSEPAEVSEVVLLLREQLAEQNRQIERLQSQLADGSQRHDTIILQMTRQLESQQNLLEHQRQPWYRRLRKQRRNSE